MTPNACALPTADRPLRPAEFDRLFATAVRRVERRGSGVRLTSPVAKGWSSGSAT